MKQKIEIEVDVPEGWEAIDFRKPEPLEFWFSSNFDQVYFSGDHSTIRRQYSTSPRLILRRVEPVKETKHANIYLHSNGSLWVGELVSTREHAIASAMSCTSKRLDTLNLTLENGVPVHVALEPTSP